jgi:hypothetical protein
VLEVSEPPAQDFIEPRNGNLQRRAVQL